VAEKATMRKEESRDGGARMRRSLWNLRLGVCCRFYWVGCADNQGLRMGGLVNLARYGIVVLDDNLTQYHNPTQYYTMRF
jgi:hypothetical protein